MNTRLFPLALPVLLGSMTAFGQSSANTSASATATIYLPIAISKTNDLVFGDVYPNATTAGTVTVDPKAGTATTSGGVSLDTLRTASPATFSISGMNSAAFTITLPSSGSMTGPGPTMALSSFSAYLGSGSTIVATSVPTNLSAGGSLTLAVGAQLAVASAVTQTQGDYTGTFNVTVAYN